MRKVTKGLVPLVALALVAAACGGDDDDSADEPAAEEPAAEEPAAEEPAAEEPAAEEPAAEEPAAEEPAEEPAAEEPAEEPAAEEPAEAPAEVLTDIGVDGTTIKVGLLSDLTGAFAATVVPLTDGEEAYIERLNASGGILGYTIDAEVVDTGYDVPTHQQLYDQFSSEGDDGKAARSAGKSCVVTPHRKRKRREQQELPANDGANDDVEFGHAKPPG